MANSQIQFHEILQYVNDQLSTNNRNMLCFLMEADIPRYLIDEVTAPHSRVPMHNIFRALIERGKISPPTDLNYLVDRLKIIQRIDLIQYIKKRLPTESTTSTTSSNSPLTSSSSSSSSPSDLFQQHNPQSTE